MIGIYKITSPTGRIYVGQSVNIKRRFRQHKSSKNKDNIGLYNSFNKHGVDNHVFEVIEECYIGVLNERERYWQDYYDVLNNGLNCKLTSCNTKTGFISESIKRKISKSKKGIKISHDALLKIKKRMSNNHPMKGKKHSLLSKSKMSISHSGTKMKEESKEKRRKTINDRCPVYDLLCRLNLSDSTKKVKKTKQWNNNISKSLMGHEISKETRYKISETLKGKMTGLLNGNSKRIIDLESGFVFDSITDFICSKKCTISYYNKHFKNKTTITFK